MNKTNLKLTHAFTDIDRNLWNTNTHELKTNYHEFQSWPALRLWKLKNTSHNILGNTTVTIDEMSY